MPESSTSFKEKFQELTLSFLWRQWSSLGVAGQSRPGGDWVIDPEALLLLTSTLGRHDPRLFDEVLDWLPKNGGLINIQRLKSLQATYGIGHPSILAAMAAITGERAVNLKWRNLSKELSLSGSSSTHRNHGTATAPSSTPEPLFPGVPVVSSPDALFLKFGWIRDKIDLRGLSTAPNPHHPANLLFKLRALWGLQARAEIMVCLLCTDATQPAQIAELTGYFPRTVQLALNEMARSGHVLTARTNREKHFQLRKEEWLFLAEPSEHGFPRWVNFAPLFALLGQIGQKILTLDETASAILPIELRVVVQKISPALLQSRFGRQLRSTTELTGDAFVAALLDDLSEILLGNGQE
jgi:hypothetical protein